MVSPALKFEFARNVRDYARWYAVPAAARSPAPGWWWGPAFAARGINEPLPEAWAPMLGLPPAASYADAAARFMAAMADQIYQPWPSDFPGREAPPDGGKDDAATTGDGTAAP